MKKWESFKHSISISSVLFQNCVLRVEHFGEGINGCHWCNAKLFGGIEHSDSVKYEQTKVDIYALNSLAGVG